MRGFLAAAILVLAFLAIPAQADEKGGPYTVFPATVRVLLAATTAGSDVPTLVRYDPKTGRTWVMIPPVAAGSSPYWVPVVEPIDFGSKK